MARFGARLGLTRYEADEYYHLALGHYDKRNLDEAVLNINQAIAMYPQRAEYYAARGYFRLQDGLPNEAEPDFDQALILNPYEILANYGKGVIAYNQQNYETARQYFTHAWAADNQRPEILYYLALVHHRQRENIQAKQWMSQAADRYEQQAEHDRDARKRMRDAEKWLREFDKLIAEAEKRAQVASD
ncbi:MAG: tetratricopeptide repeat protein [Anaerolineae bacterium]